MLHYSVGTASLQGQMRTSNQDALLAEQFAASTLLAAVADGVGAYTHSADASMLACKYTAHLVKQQFESAQLNSRTFVAGIRAVNTNLWNTAMEQTRALRTTLSAILFHERQATIAHVGDCRVYLWRDQQLQQVTRDHANTTMQSMHNLLRRMQMKLGKQENTVNSLTAHQPRRSTTVHRILGEHPIVRIDMHAIPLQAGDRFLICSDGVWSYLAQNDISASLQKVRKLRDLLSGSSDAGETAESIQANHLVNVARANGTPDDASAVIISIHA